MSLVNVFYPPLIWHLVSFHRCWWESELTFSSYFCCCVCVMFLLLWHMPCINQCYIYETSLAAIKLLKHMLFIVFEGGRGLRNNDYNPLTGGSSTGGSSGGYRPSRRGGPSGGG